VERMRFVGELRCKMGSIRARETRGAVDVRRLMDHVGERQD